MTGIWNQRGVITKDSKGITKLGILYIRLHIRLGNLNEAGQFLKTCNMSLRTQSETDNLDISARIKDMEILVIPFRKLWNINPWALTASLMNSRR